MRILFFTLVKIDSVYQRGNYSDLIREIRDRGHEIIIITPRERRFKRNCVVLKEGSATLLKVWTPNIQKTNILEKTVGLLLIQYLFKVALDRVVKSQSIDFIIYSTPPITFNWLVSYCRKRFNAKTYLLLKDIFPQNAVDLNMFGLNSLTYKYFRNVEKKLYSISDFIGTMSDANSKYLIEKTPELNPRNIEINPNSIDIITSNPKQSNSKNYAVPEEDKRVFVYGGNIGKPQKIEFLLDVIIACRDIYKAFFVIIGSGTESKKVAEWFKLNKPENALYIQEMPQNDYEQYLDKHCDVGMVFLDPRFTIPNYPSRILYYMLYKLPVLCATDTVTDIGKDAEKNNYGFECKSGDIARFKKYVQLFTDDDNLVEKYGENAFSYLKINFNVVRSYETIYSHFQFK